MPKRVGILLTHPTQYHSPWFRELARRKEIEIEVFYGFQPDAQQQGAGFGVAFEWDIPLLEGYPSRFLKNLAAVPGWSHAGCDTPEIAGTIAEKGFDAWIINGWQTKSEWQAIKACWKHRVPMLIRGDSHLLEPRPWHVRVAKRLLLGRWIPRFSRYLTVGKLNEEYYRFYGADTKKFFPVRHFVDNDWLASRSTEIRGASTCERRKWQIPTGATVFLFAGKFIEKKRPLDVLCAFERLQAAVPNVHLLMVGDGPLRAECEQFASSRKLAATFAGFLNQREMPCAYACCDVLVLPSGHSETWGLVVNEAMACGLPAIVSDHVGCAPDLVRPGETGAVFSAGNVAALAAAMEVYARQPEVARQQGLDAQKLIQAYSVEAGADSTVAAVLSALGKSASQ